MSQDILSDPRLPLLLYQVDQALAEEVRQGGCPLCGGPLHGADYPRKARYIKALGVLGKARFSFCCGCEGCRRRRTPPSVRFFGRRLWLGVIVVLYSAMAHGLNRSRLARLGAALGVDRRTLERWRTWWRSTFPATELWRDLRARFMPPPAAHELPKALVDAYPATVDGVVDLLRLLAPVSILKPAL